MSRTKHALVIASPIGRVTEVVGDSGTWTAWWTNLGAVESVDGSGAAGTSARHAYRTTSGRLHRLTTRVTRSTSSPSGSHHWRVVVDGPLVGWQSLDLEPVGAFDEELAPVGTLVTAEVSLAGTPALRDDDQADPSEALVRTLHDLKALIEG